MQPQAKEVYDYLAQEYNLRGKDLILARMIATSNGYMMQAEKEIRSNGILVEGRWGNV